VETITSTPISSIQTQFASFKGVKIEFNCHLGSKNIEAIKYSLDVSVLGTISTSRLAGRSNKRTELLYMGKIGDGL